MAEGGVCDSQDAKPKHVEKSRAALLKRSLDKSIDMCLSAVSLSVFANAYPSLQEKNPIALKNIHQQVMEQLRSNIEEEMVLMFEEENITEKLDELDEAIKSTSRDKRSTAWRPSGCVDDDLLPHLIPVKKKQVIKLQTIYKNVERENKSLRLEFVTKRKQLMKTHQKMQEKMQSLDMVYKVLEDANLTDLLENVP